MKPDVGRLVLDVTNLRGTFKKNRLEVSTASPGGFGPRHQLQVKVLIYISGVLYFAGKRLATSAGLAVSSMC
jgi:hypothetical protein